MKKTKSWRTSLLGWAALGLLGVQIAANPTALLQKDKLDQAIGQVSTALVATGLLKAADDAAKQDKQQ
jgi:hypothetical protein